MDVEELGRRSSVISLRCGLNLSDLLDCKKKHEEALTGGHNLLSSYRKPWKESFREGEEKKKCPRTVFPVLLALRAADLHTHRFSRLVFMWVWAGRSTAVTSPARPSFFFLNITFSLHREALWGLLSCKCSNYFLLIFSFLLPHHFYSFLNF